MLEPRSWQRGQEGPRARRGRLRRSISRGAANGPVGDLGELPGRFEHNGTKMFVGRRIRS